MTRSNLATKKAAVTLIVWSVFTICSPRLALAGSEVCYTGSAATMFGPGCWTSFAARGRCEAKVHGPCPSDQVIHSNLRMDEGVVLARPGDLRADMRASQLTEDAAAKVEAGDLVGALSIYKRALALYAQDQSTSSKDRITSIIEAVEKEIEARNARSSYARVPTGFVSLIAWDTEKPDGKLTAEQSAERRVAVDARLRRELREAAIPVARFVEPSDYDAIVGIGAASPDWAAANSPPMYDPGHWWSTDQIDNLAEQLRSNKAPSKLEAAYDSLAHKNFDALDCHGSGAMICLAGLRNGDVAATRVRLFGPQITPATLVYWRQLLKRKFIGNQVSSVEIFINDHDPVPAVSFMVEIFDPDLKRFGVMFEEEKAAVARFGSMPRKVLAGDVVEVIRVAAPELRVVRLPCEQSQTFDWSLKCHAASLYRESVDRKRDLNAAATRPSEKALSAAQQQEVLPALSRVISSRGRVLRLTKRQHDRATGHPVWR